jgi:hypothetical protein
VGLIKSKKPGINFLVVPPGIGRKEKVQEIEISKIQPSEHLLKKEVVDYFINNPSEIFRRRKHKIRIAVSPDPRFEFYVLDGNNRLYSYFSLGNEYVNIVPDYNYYSYLDEGGGFYWEIEEAILAIHTYEIGITKWSNLESKIIPEAEYYRIM